MVSWTVIYKSMSIGVRKNFFRMCALRVAFFVLSFFWAFGCWINFAFGTRGKTGAWAPDIVAGEEGEQEATNAAFRPRWREQLWGPGGKGNFFVKNYTFSCIFLKIREAVRSVWPGVLPRRKISGK